MSTSNSLITFQHPNKPAEIRLFSSQIFGAMEMPEQKCVVVVGPGGAMVPVRGTLDEVTAAISAAKEKNNGKRKQ